MPAEKSQANNACGPLGEGLRLRPTPTDALEKNRDLYFDAPLTHC
jgi:hypothetical protein